MISQSASTVRPSVVARTRVRAGRAGLQFAHICCFLLVVTLVWAPHWPFYRFGLAAPPYGVLDTVLAPADVLVVGIAAGWGLAVLSGQDCIEWSPCWISWPLVLFVLVGGMASVGALNQDLAMRFAIRSAGLALLYLYLRRSIDARRLAPATLTMWLVPVLACNGLLAIAQTIHQNPVGLAWLGEPSTLRGIAPTPVVLVHGTRLLRGFGLLPHPNALGGLLAAALPLVAGLLLPPAESAARARRIRWGAALREVLLLLSAATIVAGIVLSFSRSAWLGLLCGGLYLILWRWAGRGSAIQGPSRKRVALLVVSMALLLSGLLAVEWDAVSVRLQPASNRLEMTSIQQRLSLLRLSFTVISWRPLTGVGGDNFALAAARFPSTHQPSPSSDSPVHNTYLLAEAELGPLGGAAWLALMAVPLLYLVRQRSRRHRAAALRIASGLGAVPRAFERGVAQIAITDGPWRGAAASAAEIGFDSDGREAGRGGRQGSAQREVPALMPWQGLAACSLVVVAVVGLFDWYLWGNGLGNEPVAVVWVIALALLTAPESESQALRQPERHRINSIAVALFLLAVLALAIGSVEYLTSDRVLPRVSVNTVNVKVGGQTEDAIALQLRPFSIMQRFRVIALIVTGQAPIMIPAYKLGYRIDNGLTAWRAYNVGHSGSMQHRLSQLAQTLINGSMVRMAQRVDEGTLRNVLFRLRAAVNRAPRPSLPGRSLNVAMAQRQIARLLIQTVGAFRVHLPIDVSPALPALQTALAWKPLRR